MVVAVFILLGGFWQLARYQWTARYVALEALRLGIVASILFTLCQPEWVSLVRPQQKPVLGVLADDSRSMETQDALLENESVSRRQRIASFRESSMWQGVTMDYQVNWQDFESSDSGQTNIHRALSASGGAEALVLFSDGDWNAGEPPSSVASMLGGNGIAVIAISLGTMNSQPDLILESQAIPRTVVIGESVKVPYALINRFSESREVELSFLQNDVVLETKRTELQSGRRLEETFQWIPDEEGDATLRIIAAQQSGEAQFDNNAIEYAITVAPQALKVLVLESRPRWEFRYLRNALMRDPGVEVHCLLYHGGELGMGNGPGYLDTFPDPAALSEYDVVFIGDLGVREGQLRREDAENLKELVETQSSGLVFLPGKRGHQSAILGTSLGDLMPVTLDAANPQGIASREVAALELTDAGRRNALTALGADSDNERIWRSLPGFSWHAAVKRAKAGSLVLAVHESKRTASGRMPLLVTRPFGRGQVLFLGTDGAWRWRRGVEDRYHYRFWGQVARWMAYQRAMGADEHGRLIVAPERPEVGGRLSVNTTLLGHSRNPLTEQRVTATLVHAEAGELERVDLREEEGGWGTYSGSLAITNEGQHTLTVSAEDEGVSITKEVNVKARSLEPIGEPARPEVMKGIAQLSGGAHLDASDVQEKLPNLLKQFLKQEPREVRTRLWSHPLWMAWIIGLMTVYWMMRKRIGLV